MCASSSEAVVRGLQWFSREQTCSNLEMTDGFRRLRLEHYRDISTGAV